MGTFTTTEPYPPNYVPQLLLETWRRFEAKEEPAEVGPDGFPEYADHPLTYEHRLLSDYIRETARHLFTEVDLKRSTAGQSILALDDAAKARVTMAALERFPWFWKTGVQKTKDEFFGKGWRYDEPIWRWNFRPLLGALLRAALPFSTEQFTALLGALLDPPDGEAQCLVPAKTVVRLAQKIWGQSIPAPVLEGLKRLHNTLAKQHRGTAEERKVFEELGYVIGKPRPQLIHEGEAWANAAMADLAAMTEEKQADWSALLNHCVGAVTSAPTKKWLKQADELVGQVGLDSFRAAVIKWFSLVALPRPVHQIPRHAHLPDPDMLIGERNAILLRGLAWSCAGVMDASISGALSNLAEVCFKKVRWLGARCPKVGNACLFSLSATASDEAAAQLSRLDATVKQPTAKKRIGKSLDKAAELTGQTREDLEESTVPTYGLDEHACLRQAFGEFTADFRIRSSHETELTWHKAGGKTQKSVPAAVKEQHAAEFKQFKRTMGDIEKMLLAQRVRIERLLFSEREWSLEQWRERYLNHPLLAGFVRRLIWHFTLGSHKATAIWHEGALVDVEDRPLDWLASEARVRLWHPIGFDANTVGAWRSWLEGHQVAQPFKQAHREIYIITEAELQTETYSHRFAAHILKQHQFTALAQQRGWQYRLMGNFDFQSTPTLLLPRWGLAAEFWVQPTGGQDDESEAGISLYLSTDQVRFCGPDGNPRPLTDVPALVFSEVMRDMDLFVGVCSIGADPAWQDTGLADGTEYWQRHSFGDLSGTAQTRREVLGRLLPKLKIASRCKLQDRFLHVRGDLRTYKIHFGSGNILMEPNDQYLCIVPDRRFKSREEVFLPFEGDSTLSVILSKAFMLADDSKITETAIVSQIRRG